MSKIKTYWPVYKNLEQEFLSLIEMIHLDDNQLDVYSVKISELILRCGSEIESITKDLYKLDNAPKRNGLAYDKHCIPYFITKWILEKKVININHLNYFSEIKSIQPFAKDDDNIRNKSGLIWNDVYQRMKHNRSENLSKATFRNLLKILSALYLLSVYCKDHRFPITSRYELKQFPFNMGSEIFSVELHLTQTISYPIFSHKDEAFKECVYIKSYTEDDMKKYSDMIEQTKVNHRYNLYEKARRNVPYPDRHKRMFNEVEPFEEFIEKKKAEILNATKNDPCIDEFIGNLNVKAILNKNQFPSNVDDEFKKILIWENLKKVNIFTQIN